MQPDPGANTTPATLPSLEGLASLGGRSAGRVGGERKSKKSTKSHKTKKAEVSSNSLSPAPSPQRNHKRDSKLEEPVAIPKGIACEICGERDDSADPCFEGRT
jgi:hypothetical protein